MNRKDAQKALKGSGIYPTHVLADALLFSLPEKWSSITASWKEILEGVKTGNIDHSNALHMELAYSEYAGPPSETRPIERKEFGKILRGEAVFRQVVYDELENIIAEADFFAYEALNLVDFLDEARGFSNGFKVEVVANKSFGSFIIEGVKDKLDDRLMAVTYAHAHSSILPDLFSESEGKKIMNSNNSLVIVDVGRGTYSTFKKERAARYSSSHAPFVYFFAAANAALTGRIPEEHMKVLTRKEIEELSQKQDFKKMVEDLSQYKGENQTPYTIEFWNPQRWKAGSEMRKGKYWECFDASTIRPRTIIFATPSIQHDLLPGKLKEMHPGIKHDNDYFNDHYDRLEKLPEPRLKKEFVVTNGAVQIIEVPFITEARPFTLADRVAQIENLLYR